MHIFKQVIVSAVFLVSVCLLLDHERVNVWLFNGMLEWICLIFPMVVAIICWVYLVRIEPVKKVRRRIERNDPPPPTSTFFHSKPSPKQVPQKPKEKSQKSHCEAILLPYNP